MIKKFIIAIVVVFLIVLGAIFFANQNYVNSLISSLNGELTVPEYVSVRLASSVKNNERVLVLTLRTAAPSSSGCDSISDLKLQKSLSSDTLTVDIKGYKFTENAVGPCPAVMLESRQTTGRVKVDLDWLKQNGDKEIIFKLDGQDNRYKISYNKYQVTLSEVQATNVIVTDEPWYNPSESPTTWKMTLYPVDVASMYLADPVSSEKDYRPAMRDYARSKGLIPVEEIYAGLEQGASTRLLYVVLKNRPMPNPVRYEVLGELPGEGVRVKLIWIPGHIILD